MAYYDDINKISKKLMEAYQPIIKMINSDAVAIASRNMTQSLAQISSLQQNILLNDSVVVAINNMREMMSIMVPVAIDISDTMQRLIESIRPSIELINANMTLFQENYANIAKGLGNIGYNLSELVQQAYIDMDVENDNDDFTSNDEIIEVLQEQAYNPKGFQEKVAEWSQAKKKKYFIIISIIIFIWSNFIGPYFEDTVGKPVTAYVVSKVRDLPATAGKVIDELKENIEAIITEDVPYYYKVTYTDEDGNMVEGYVAKKNMKVIENDEEIEEVNQ